MSGSVVSLGTSGGAGGGAGGHAKRWSRGGVGRWVRAGVAACVALVSAPALAQPTAEQIVDRALQSIAQTTATATQRLENGSARAVTGVEQLDLLGAPDRKIIAFGQHAIEVLNRVAVGGRERIEATTRTAVRALRRLNAPQAMIDQVTAAAAAGKQSIGQARVAAVQAVRDAVEEAIGPP